MYHPHVTAAAVWKCVLLILQHPHVIAAVVWKWVVLRTEHLSVTRSVVWNLEKGRFGNAYFEARTIVNVSTAIIWNACFSAWKILMCPPPSYDLWKGAVRQCAPSTSNNHQRLGRRRSESMGGRTKWGGEEEEGSGRGQGEAIGGPCTTPTGAQCTDRPESRTAQPAAGEVWRRADRDIS